MKIVDTGEGETRRGGDRETGKRREARGKRREARGRGDGPEARGERPLDRR